MDQLGSLGSLAFGFSDTTYANTANLSGSYSPAFGSTTSSAGYFSANGSPTFKYNGSGNNLSGYLNAISTGDVIGIAFDKTTGKMWVSINGQWQGCTGSVFNTSNPILASSLLSGITLVPVVQLMSGLTNSSTVTLVTKKSQMRYYDAFVAGQSFVPVE